MVKIFVTSAEILVLMSGECLFAVAGHDGNDTTCYVMFYDIPLIFVCLLMPASCLPLSAYEPNNTIRHHCATKQIGILLFVNTTR